MAPGPLQIQPRQREVLAEFERRYANWWRAAAAAEAAERDLARHVREHETGKAAAPDAAEIQRVLDLRAVAAQLQHEAMQLLRDEPI